MGGELKNAPFGAFLIFCAGVLSDGGNSQAFAANGAATVQYLTARLCCHFFAETVRFNAAGF